MESYEYTAQVVGMVEKAAFPGPSPGGLIGSPQATDAIVYPCLLIADYEGWRAILTSNAIKLQVSHDGRWVADYGPDDMIEVPYSVGGLPGSIPQRARALVESWAEGSVRTEAERNAARTFCGYPQAQETLQPDWKQQYDAAQAIIQNLEAELARAKAEIQAHLARTAALDTQLQAAKEEPDALLKLNDALIDLVTEVAAFVREHAWDDDAQANRVKAALAAHEQQYGRRGE